MNKQNDSMKEETGTCGPGCSCGTTLSGGRGRWIVGIVVLLVAGVLVARGVMKESRVKTAPASTGFAALPPPAQTSAAAPVASAPSAETAVKEIAALSELNEVASNTVGVFVFVPGKSATTAKVPAAQIKSAVQTMEPQLKGGKIGIFALKAGSLDYDQIASQMDVPVVLAMVKGAGMVPVTGEITETKLVQGYVAASSAGGCGSGGCGPRGCK